MQSFEIRLTGGHPNSLGNTIEVVEEVLNQPDYFDELFHCYFSKDEVVRLRVSNAMKRICKENKEILLPYIERFLNEISTINQASTQWTLSQLYLQFENNFTREQKAKAIQLMKSNLEHHTDWIVLNTTMDTLHAWSSKDSDLKLWMKPHLERLSKDNRKSVAKKATKLLSQ